MCERLGFCGFQAHPGGEISPKNRILPVNSLQNRENRVETGSQMTASTTIFQPFDRCYDTGHGKICRSRS